MSVPGQITGTLPVQKPEEIGTIVSILSLTGDYRRLGSNFPADYTSLINMVANAGSLLLVLPEEKSGVKTTDLFGISYHI